MNFSRRAAILGATALPMIRIVKGQSRPKFIAVGSANRNNGGLKACTKAVDVVKAGGDTFDARNDSVGYGGPPSEVARNFDNDENRLAGIDIQFYALRKDGAYCGASLWNKSSISARQGAQMAVCTEGPGQHEDCVYLLERKG